ncbi:MAG: polysaccharide deacetylase family protein [Candidatus Riflebacteria bacterium]|nr:polysaccharide deacetylase family protein [Candidatus Riflebacteria bacterium]
MIKVIFPLILALLSAFWAYSDFSENTLLILTFHGVTDNPQLPWEISYLKLKDCVDKFENSGYRHISPDLVEKWLSGEDRKGRFIFITFDDGLKSSYHAMKMLYSEKQIFSGIFLITDFIGKPGYVSTEDILELNSSGFHIFLHGKSHDSPQKLEKMKLVSDLKYASKFLSELASTSFRSWYAYPYGEYNEASVDAVKLSGLRYAFTIDGDSISAPQSNLLLVPRVMYLKAPEDSSESVFHDWLPPDNIRTGYLKILISLFLLMFSAFSFLKRGSDKQ